VSRLSLLVKIDRNPEGACEVLSPAVGWWLDAPTVGSAVGPASVVGRLLVLNRAFRLVMPDGPTGRVVHAGPTGRRAVGFGERLFRLSAFAEEGDPQAGRPDAASPGSAPSAGVHVVTSPTDGVFYLRPSPDAPPFVEVGATLRAGQAIGLVEVMKTFHEIAFGGPGLPESAEVKEICCSDGDEVRAGQPLLRVGEIASE